MNPPLDTIAAQPILLLLCIAPLLLFFVGSRFLQKHYKPYPPGPKGWPLIGNMRIMDQLTHRGLAKLTHQYGGLFHLKLGSLHMVVVSSPEAAREVLQVQDKIFCNRPYTIAIRYLTYERAGIAFADYGPFWQQMRKMSVMKLFRRRRAGSWNSVRDEVDRLVRVVAHSPGSAVNVGELVIELARNVMYRAVFGSSSTEGRREFMKILDEFSELFFAFNVADFFPWLRWIDPQGFNKRLTKARAALDGFIDSIIDDRLLKKKLKNGFHEEADGDLVDELLAFFTDEADVSGLDGMQGCVKLTRNNIKAIVMEVMHGGTETVASAMEWMMLELMRNPLELNRIQQELNDAVGLGRRLKEEDFEKLPYLRCCLKETLRLHPSIPLLAHQTVAATEVAGYRIPGNSRVMINAWAIARDGNSWTDPEAFQPSRFLMESAAAFKGNNNFEFIPFGWGRRSCPGMQLGIYTLEMAVGHLLHCFTWEFLDGKKPSELDVEDMSGLTAPRASRLIAVPSMRLQCPL